MSLIVPDFSDFFDVLHRSLLNDEVYGTPAKRQREGTQGRVDVFRPKTDILEYENEVTVLTELPGLTKDQVNISLDNNRLTIGGETRASSEYGTEGTQTRYKERTFSSFSRSFNVPAGIKPEEIKAGLENGVLKVTFPKKVDKPEAKQITIQ